MSAAVPAAAAAAAAVPTAVVPPPNAPKMGTVEETYAGSGHFNFIFGGKPLYDWSGLDTNSPHTSSDMCYRPLDRVSGQKGTVYRTKGATQKLSRSIKLSTFQEHLWNHMKEYGLDTIGYLNNPHSNGEMISVVEQHARFTGDMSKAIAQSQVLKAEFDSWDNKHDHEATKHLLASLDEDILDGLTPYLDRKSDTFVITWLRLIHYLVTTTSSTYDNMKEQIRKLRPSHYEGQNIEQLAKQFMSISKELTNAGYYEHSLTTNMIEGFLCATQDEQGTFHHSMNTLLKNHQKKIQDTIFMTKDDQDKEFAVSQLSYTDVCLLATRDYKGLVAGNKWEPAKVPKDRQKPSSYLTKAQVQLMLDERAIKPGGNSSAKKGWKKDKFNKEDKRESKSPLSQSEANARRHQNMAKWKLTPPKNVEPKSKKVNDRDFNWCDKCKNWTPSHETNTHTGKMPSKASNGMTQANVLSPFEPQAWCVEASCSPSTKSIFQYLYFVLSIGIFLGLRLPSFAILTESLDIIIINLQSYWNAYATYQTLMAASAPLLWFSLGVMTSYLYSLTRVASNQATHPIHLFKPETRTIRRRYKSKHKGKWKHNSIKQNHLCPSYPLRLRKDNVFNRRHDAPTIEQQQMSKMLELWVISGSTNVGTIASSRKGKSKFNNNRSHHKQRKQPLHHHAQPFHHQSTVHNKRHQRYKPIGVPTARYNPNLNYTSSQLQNARQQAARALMLSINISDQTKTLATMIVQSVPACFRSKVTSSTNPSSPFNLIWDTGASICITPSRDDFVEYYKGSDVKEVKGLSEKVKVKGYGFVEWTVQGANGVFRTIKLKAYHLPQSNARLLSTNVLLTSYKGEQIHVTANYMELSGNYQDPSKPAIIVHNSPLTRLPTSVTYNQSQPLEVTTSVNNLCQTCSTVQSTNQNLSESEKELLKWHYKLGHLSFSKIQHLMRTGVLSHTEATRHLHTASAKIKSPPKCAACMFAKQTVRSSPGVTSHVIKDRAGVLRAGNLHPGAEVSVDHFISSLKGRLFKGYDKGGEDTRLIGGCIFVDHSSSFIHVEFQSSLSSHDTLRAKLAYERMCRDSGVVIQTYMSDNGKSFTSKEFAEHLSEYYQTSKFAGVGAHHHNAQAERAIRTIMSIARAMMIHAGIHWPDVAKASLWPMAVSHASFLWNHVPSPATGLSPSDLFTRTRWSQRKFHDLHVWGCPLYVLDKSLQDGKKIPKWKPRSHRAIYVGVSPAHASTVPLALNTSTGSITPQFHVVFDDWFATVTSESEDAPDFSSAEWQKMFGDSRYQYMLNPEGEATTDTSDEADHNANRQRDDIISDLQDQAQPPQPLPVPMPATSPMPIPPTVSSDNQHQQAVSSNPPMLQHQPTPTAPPLPIPPTISSDNPPVIPIQRKQVSESPPQRKPVTVSSPPIRRSSRQTKPSHRFTYTHDKQSRTHNIPESSYAESNHVCAHLVYEMIEDEWAMAANKSQSNADIFTYDQAMASEHRSKWIEAAKKEIDSLDKLGCWDEVPVHQATSKIIPGTWVLRIKRAPDGSFKKFKARYCIRGDLQEGVSETFAPVSQFSSVRLFLAWSLMLGWDTSSIDFSNAFIQADLDEPVYIYLPRGFKSSIGQKSCLKLNKSIYGLTVAPRLWFQKILKTLLKLGLKQSKHDQCLLFRNDLFLVIYVDDIGLAYSSQEVLSTFIQNLKDEGFTLTMEESFNEYLGVKYEKQADGSIAMTQDGLIQKIIEATGMQECNPNRVPASREALGMNPEGESMTDAWNYRSVVGMLLYLTTNTRPDIAFAVSQVARFSHNPKASHASAVKTIIRYLAGTKSKGINYRRPDKLTLDCFVDADYAGLYGRDPDNEPTSAKSRTGYIISLGGCYILCKSQLQTTIALSTSEAEYGALSSAMRVVLPIRDVVLELLNCVDLVDSYGTSIFPDTSDPSAFETFIHEDNNTALSLAVNQRITSRTKHWCVKSHFFWHHVNDKSKNIKCVKVDTKLQRADYLTKGLSVDLYTNCRNLNQGW